MNDLSSTIDNVNKLLRDLDFDEKSEKDLSLKNVSTNGINTHHSHLENSAKFAHEY